MERVRGLLWTNLAHTLMREHPEGIRSVVIDSVEPPSVVNVGGFWGNASEGFDKLPFAHAPSNPTVGLADPDLRRDLHRSGA